MHACFTIAKEVRPIRALAIQRIVVGLHLPWEGVWQRPNHIITRLARHAAVTVLEECRSGPVTATEARTHDGITVVTPLRAAPPQDAIDDASLAALRTRVTDRQVLLWLYTPMMLALTDVFPGAPLVFDKMDELAKFAGADPRLPEREARTLQRAEAVFTGGRSLHETVAARTAHARCYPSGVDAAHFARARDIAPHPELAGLRRPVFGYVGVIDERLDLPLIAAAAAARPDATFALVGPIVKIDPATVPRAGNIVYLGRRAYDELPAILAGIDVALMPFAINEHTHNISPTKTLEYLAAGKPVVSTRIRDVVADHADVVTLAGTPDDFIAGLARAAQPDPDRDARVAAKLAATSWDGIVDGMLADLEARGIVFRPSAA